ncbi:hypothetical protein FGO68_gene3487 [Halteria grandinella]|uniref:Uncharacterized protein n=1 Tax=Halteria grandinella TaxID=5974 RepID=A0A8J8NMC6_HALGN|nr:hypothetical protein FGO68_gene3487 [Halteria grandinella]
MLWAAKATDKSHRQIYSLIFLFPCLQLSLHLSLHDFLLLLQCAPVDLVNILAVRDLLLAAVRVLLLLAKNSPYLIVQPLAPVPHIEYLQRFLHGHAALERFIVHEELDKVEELAGLEAGLVVDAALVHGVVLIAGDIAIEVIVHFPDDKSDLGLEGLLAQEEEDFHQVPGAYLLPVLGGLLGVQRKIVTITESLRRLEMIRSGRSILSGS